MCSTTIEWYLNDNYFFLSKKKEDNIVATFNLEELTEEYAKELYKDKKLSSKTEKKLFHAVYQPLKEAVQEGFSQIASKIEYGTPNYEMLKNLQHNTGVYSAFKNHAMVKEMVELLKDEQGNLKPFQQFKTDALKIDDKYRANWLKTEYDTAVRTARMAAQWERIQRTKHLYPNLEYIRSKAANPDIDHLALVGTILPVDDPFWSTYYPPSRWNCQCSVRQTDKGVTDTPADAPTVDKEFAFNAGKTGQIFDVQHSDYIKSVSKEEMPKLIKMAKKEVDKDIIHNLEYQTMYESKKSGGKVDVHPLAINNSDFNEVFNAARSLANNGKKIKILPDVVETELRQSLLPLYKIKGNTNPDYFVDNKYVMDLKILNGNRSKTVQNAIKSCNEQCDNIVLWIAKDNPIEYNNLLKWIKGKLKYDNYKDFDKIWINYNGSWKFLTKDIIMKMDFSFKSK